MLKVLPMSVRLTCYKRRGDWVLHFGKILPGGGMKEIINQYYGSYSEFSYFSGGSSGGKEGQVSAQKFYHIYDGFYIGCPLGGMVVVTFRGTWHTPKGAGLFENHYLLEKATSN